MEKQFENILFLKYSPVDKKLKIKDHKELHRQLFSEEYDYFGDSYSDARDRAAGKSPMNKDYQEKVRKKRALLGVDQLSESGMPMSELSLEFCKKEVEAAEQDKQTDKTAFVLQILQEIEDDRKELMEKHYAQANKTVELRKTIDVRDPSTWTDTMIENSYALMERADMWELNSTMPFEEFKAQLFSDPDFAEANAPKAGSLR